MSDPVWLEEATKYIGTKEFKGQATSPVIAGWLQMLKAWWTDDETPWCGVFVAMCMTKAGIQPPKTWMRALSWAAWGWQIKEPALGCVVVFSREGGGHVALAVGKDTAGRILCLGGNQGDEVSIKPFSTDRVVAYRWPQCDLEPQPLPVLQAYSHATASTREA